MRKFFNLEKDQQKGLKGQIKKKKEYFETDKSGRISDEELVQKFGEKKKADPVIHNKVELSREEKKLLKLSPKFTVHEQVDLEELKLNLKKAGVKGRWTEWVREEREGQADKEMEERREVMNTSFWVKGSDSVDWSKLMVTDMKGNRRLFISKPVTKTDYEVKWRNAE